MKQLTRVTALLVVLATPLGASELPLTEPDPSLSPRDVVSIQIEALRNNDIPYEDKEIEVAEADFGAFRSLSATLCVAMTLAVAIGERRGATGD